MPAATSRKGKSRAQDISDDQPEAVLPLGKQLAHTGMSLRHVLCVNPGC